MTENDLAEARPWYEELYPSIDQFALREGDTFLAALAEAIKIKKTTPAGNREWINKICQIAGITSTELARAAGLAPSTINRFLKQTEKPGNINATTMAAIMSAGYSYMRVKFKSGEDIVALFSEVDRVQSHVTDYKRVVQTRNINILGIVKADLYCDIAQVEYSDQDQFTMNVPVRSSYADTAVVGLEYRTDRSGEGFSDEDILICVPTFGDTQLLEEEDRVIVNQRDQESRIATSLRHIMADPKGIHWLVAEGEDANYVAPIRLGKKPFQVNTELYFISFVVASVYHWLS